MYIGEADLYIIDPDFAKSKNPKDRRAHMDLLFTVEDQPLVEIDEGYRGQRAWRSERRAMAAVLARARIDAAADGDSDESGHDDMHDSMLE